MEKNNEKDGFSYTYSAREQTELRRIREKYESRLEIKEDKMTRLRRLDASVTQAAQIVSLILGIVGVLILGFGMSLCMTNLSEILGSNQTLAMSLGVLIGIVGGILVSLAYPVYNAIVRHRRKKLAPEILRLTDELMK